MFIHCASHFHSKGDFDGAIAQYKLTIGTLEPSYVIRKVHVHDYSTCVHFYIDFYLKFCITLKYRFLFQFLDAQRIHNLTDYLKVCELPVHVHVLYITCQLLITHWHNLHVHVHCTYLPYMYILGTP